MTHQVRGRAEPTGDIQVVHELLRVPPPLDTQVPLGPRAPILGSYLGSYQEGIAVVAPDGRVRLFTAGLERITGFSARDLPTVDVAARLLAPDDDGVRGLREFLDAALGARDPGERLVRIRDRSGQERWLRTSVHRIDEDVLIHVLDITSIHRVEAAPPTGGDPWRGLLEEFELGAWAMDDPQSGRMTWANAAARAIFGLGPRWGGAPLEQVLSPVDPADRVRFLHALMADRFTQARTIRMVTQLALPGGTQTVNAELTASAIYDPYGRPTRVVGTVRDLGAVRGTETRRLHAELLLRALFEHASVGVVVGTLDGVFLAANQAFCALIGYQETELLGRHVDEVVHPEDRGVSDGVRKAALAGGQRALRYPRRYLHRDGHVVHCEVTLMAVHDDDGTPVWGVAMVLPEKMGLPTETA